jgi:integrase/recombinase XerD
MTLEEAVERYLSELERRNYSRRTLKEYGYDLGVLCRFLAEQHIFTVETVTSASLSEYQRWLYDQPTPGGTARSVITQNRMLAPLKKMFRFLVEESILGRDPSKDLERGKEPHRLPRQILTPREAKRIIESIDTTHVLGYRNRTLMEVLYATGIRSSELGHLRLGDINFDQELLTVRHGKGDRDRVVPLSSIASQFLKTYISGIRPHLVKRITQDHVFLSIQGKPLFSKSLNNIIETHLRKTGFKKHVTCHVWRHTCATHLVQNNAHLRHVQEMLGHRNITTTERYLQLTINDLKKAHRKFHPRETDKEKKA